MSLEGEGIRPLTDAEFQRFQGFVDREAGIHLSGAKKALLVGRLARRLRELGLRSFGDYFRRVQEDPQERIAMIDALCTHETHFFREPRQFEFLAAHVFPRWAAQAAAGTRPRHVRVWSAACSSGEEPFSIAMSLLAHFPVEAGWTHEVVASDLSTRILDRARTAVWPIEKASEIPETLRRRFMLRGIGSQIARMKAGPEIRGIVRFLRANLHDQVLPVGGPFDLVFCRNVLIYFGAEARQAAVRRLLDRLAPQGLLLLGHAESLSALSDRVRSVGPTVYVRTEAAAPLEAAGPAPR